MNVKHNVNSCKLFPRVFLKQLISILKFRLVQNMRDCKVTQVKSGKDVKYF